VVVFEVPDLMSGGEKRLEGPGRRNGCWAGWQGGSIPGRGVPAFTFADGAIGVAVQSVTERTFLVNGANEPLAFFAPQLVAEFDDLARGIQAGGNGFAAAFHPGTADDFFGGMGEFAEFFEVADGDGEIVGVELLVKGAESLELLFEQGGSGHKIFG